MAHVRVRYFAAARAAAGTAGETIEARCVDDALATLRARHDEQFAVVLEASSLLLDGGQVHDRRGELAADVSLDVLPPFAGG